MTAVINPSLIRIRLAFVVSAQDTMEIWVLHPTGAMDVYKNKAKLNTLKGYKDT